MFGEKIWGKIKGKKSVGKCQVIKIGKLNQQKRFVKKFGGVGVRGEKSVRKKPFAKSSENVLGKVGRKKGQKKFEKKFKKVRISSKKN